MDIDDFMDLSKPVKKIVVKGSSINAYQPYDTKDFFKVEKKEPQGDKYAIKLKQEQDEKMRQTFSNLNNLNQSTSSGFDMPEEDDIELPVWLSGPKMDAQLELYKKYKFNQRVTMYNNLKIFQYERDILMAVYRNPVVIIKGETGCGKSTQVPQMILDDAYRRDAYCNILVTQPRRIAATSLAQHVANMRECMLGTLVGFQVGLEKDVGDDTRLLYCTTGVALQKLVKMQNMSAYTHIILDEVHERDEDMEFLLIVVKMFLVDKSPHTKLILMSATFDTEEFAKYFRVPCDRGMTLAPTIDLHTEREYRINIYYLDDIRPIAQEAPMDYDTPNIDTAMYQVGVTLVTMFCKWDKTDLNRGKNLPCILVFLPGMQEIQRMYNYLSKEMEEKQIKLKLVPLHSTISSENQKDVFRNPAPGYRKVILATNIAESSITVPDVGYVVDFCLTRTLEADNSTGFATLKLCWASKSNCQQRAGRTGRTCKGRVYRLIDKYFYEDHMRESDQPALQRCALEKVVLKSKMLDLGMAPHNIIGLAINPPDKTNIENAVILLKETRGLHLTMNGRFVEDDGDLTFLGHIMDSLPLDIRATRLIVLGYIFSVFDECIIIAAGITVQKIFHADMRKPIKSFYHKLTFADGSGSDLIAILHAYLFWMRRIHDNRYPDEASKQKAADFYCLDLKGLNEMHNLITEIRERLAGLHMLETEGSRRVPLSEREKNIMIKVCISGAFYPNFFLRESVNMNDKERRIFHELNGRDPCTTIYYKGMDNKQYPILYQNQIKNFLRENNVVGSTDEVKISMDDGSSKIFVTFGGKQESIDKGYNFDKPISDWMPGRVKAEVYKALKLSRENIPLKLNILSDRDCYAYAKELGIAHSDEFNSNKKREKYKLAQLCILPDIHTKYVVGNVRAITHPNKFWFRPFADNNEKVLGEIGEALRHHKLPKLNPTGVLLMKVVAVSCRAVNDPRKEKFYRAKILSEMKSSDDTTLFKLLRIDEGDEITAEFESLRSIDKITIPAKLLGLNSRDEHISLVDIPPRVFECSLAEIQASYIQSSAGKWTPDAVEEFKRECDHPLLVADIYSVWNGVVSVILKDPDDFSINTKLINKQLAQRCEENYPSKQDHALRYRTQTFDNPGIDNKKRRNKDISNEMLDYLKNYYEKPLPAPSARLLSRVVTLRGPYSPLESQIHATTRAGSISKPEIERFSVNTVLLDTDPQEPNERLVIACAISTNRSGLTLRNTSIMPHIHGFSVIMAGIFAPIVEVHRDPSATRYTSILCGLGAKKRKGNVVKSRFEEHDLTIPFDVLMQEDDMQYINKVRYLMSALLYTLPGEKVPNLDHEKVMTLKRDIFRTTMMLLRKKRNFVDTRPSTNDYDWGKIDEEDLLECQDVYGDKAIFPMFRFMKLKPESEEDNKILRDNNQLLYAIAFANAQLPYSNEIRCQLCQKTLLSVPELQIHLFTKLHQDRADHCHASFQIESYLKNEPEEAAEEDEFPSLDELQALAAPVASTSQKYDDEYRLANDY